MTRHACSLVSEALLDELLREPGADRDRPGLADVDAPDFLCFPSLHDRLEASRDCPGSAPYGLWSDDPWGGDAA